MANLAPHRKRAAVHAKNERFVSLSFRTARALTPRAFRTEKDSAAARDPAAQELRKIVRDW